MLLGRHCWISIADDEGVLSDDGLWVTGREAKTDASEKATHATQHKGFPAQVEATP
jgi:hypothetical protein